MDYETIIVDETPLGMQIVFNRLENKNSINLTMTCELVDAFNKAAQNNKKMAVLKGQQKIFCTGMDFEAFANSEMQSSDASTPTYMDLLRTMSLFPGVVVSLVDGEVMAGGVGLVAASDFVIATKDSKFSLSEALWGLLPAMLTPYLIRRTGFHNAYRMTLTTIPVSAQRAYETNLIDQLAEDAKNADELLKRLWLRAGKLEAGTIKEMKEYFRSMWIITREMEKTAEAEILKLTYSPKVKENIENFVKYGIFPWN